MAIKKEPSYRKISVNLPIETLTILRGLAAQEQVTMTETLKRAISVLKFVDDAQRGNKAVLLKDLNTDETERVIFW